jgi:hypothetical protein
MPGWKRARPRNRIIDYTIARKKEIKKMNGQYEVLSPWAEVDPITFRGLAAPRLTNLAGKKIGLFASSKPISKRIIDAVEARLKEKFPTTETSVWVGQGPWSVVQVDTDRRESYKDWVKGVDAVIAAVGD